MIQLSRLEKSVASRAGETFHPSPHSADDRRGRIRDDHGPLRRRQVDPALDSRHARPNDEGTTIVQVTHSEENAAYGNRIIRLRDGWIVND